MWRHKIVIILEIYKKLWNTCEYNWRTILWILILVTLLDLLLWSLQSFKNV